MNSPELYAVQDHLQRAWRASGATRGGTWSFGSRAAGCAHARSDWDVLVVSDRPVRVPGLLGIEFDLVVLTSSELGSIVYAELASHVAQYGLRLDDGSRVRVPNVPRSAAPTKARIVNARAERLARVWESLQVAQRQYRALRLRRDLQRAQCLAIGEAVPPTAYLDVAWTQLGSSARGRVLDRLPRPIALAIDVT